MNISLPPTLKQWVDQQIEQGGHGTAGAYIQHLIRQERKRQGRIAIEKQLLEAIDSGEPIPVTAETWRESFQEVDARIRATSKKRRVNAKNR